MNVDIVLWYVAIHIVTMGHSVTACVIYSQEIIVKAKWDSDQLCLDKTDVPQIHHRRSGIQWLQYSTTSQLQQFNARTLDQVSVTALEDKCIIEQPKHSH